MLSHANLLPIQKINKYIFGSKRKKGEKKASLATVWIMDYRCARVAARREMGGMLGHLGQYIQHHFKGEDCGPQRGQVPNPKPHSLDVEDGLGGESRSVRFLHSFHSLLCVLGSWRCPSPGPGVRGLVPRTCTNSRSCPQEALINICRVMNLFTHSFIQWWY